MHASATTTTSWVLFNSVLINGSNRASNRDCAGEPQRPYSYICFCLQQRQGSGMPALVTASAAALEHQFFNTSLLTVEATPTLASSDSLRRPRFSASDGSQVWIDGCCEGDPRSSTAAAPAASFVCIHQHFSDVERHTLRFFGSTSSRTTSAATATALVCNICGELIDMRQVLRQSSAAPALRQ
jgi:hypothetical protein